MLPKIGNISSLLSKLKMFIYFLNVWNFFFIDLKVLNILKVFDPTIMTEKYSTRNFQTVSCAEYLGHLGYLG